MNCAFFTVYKPALAQALRYNGIEPLKVTKSVVDNSTTCWMYARTVEVATAIDTFYKQTNRHTPKEIADYITSKAGETE